MYVSWKIFWDVLYAMDYQEDTFQNDRVGKEIASCVSLSQQVDIGQDVQEGADGGKLKYFDTLGSNGFISFVD